MNVLIFCSMVSGTFLDKNDSTMTKERTFVVQYMTTAHMTVLTGLHLMHVQLEIDIFSIKSSSHLRLDNDYN